MGKGRNLKQFVFALDFLSSWTKCECINVWTPIGFNDKQARVHAIAFT